VHTRTYTILLVLMCCAALAVPAAAFAQSPTGDAYGGVAGQQQGTGSGGSGGGGGAGPTGSSPVQAVSPSTSAGGAGGGGGGGSLPFTGFQLGLAALVGAGLLGTGVVLRRTVRQQAGA
jgi:hypothetical protein